MKWILFSLFLGTFFISGCDIRKREIAIQKKEADLAHREQQVLIQEEALRLKEEELLRKAKLLDSTRQDSVASMNPRIVGQWMVRMECIETTCPGSAIGDIKTETWNIVYQENQVIATAMDNNKVVRTYSGTYKNNQLQLSESVETTGNAPATQMLVRLRLLNEHTMEGEREIIRSGDCRIIYALQLNK